MALNLKKHSKIKLGIYIALVICYIVVVAAVAIAVVAVVADLFCTIVLHGIQDRRHWYNFGPNFPHVRLMNRSIMVGAC